MNGVFTKTEYHNDSKMFNYNNDKAINLLDNLKHSLDWKMDAGTSQGLLKEMGLDSKIKQQAKRSVSREKLAENAHNLDLQYK